MLSTLHNEIKKPFNALSLLIALFSIILSVYFYNISKKEPRPTYSVYSEINKVFDSQKNSPKLILLDENNEPVKEDIYLMTVCFWNSGTLSIEPQDIRKDVRFIIEDCTEIVDYNIITQTNPDITEFKISLGEDRKSLLLKWRYLDPK